MSNCQDLVHAANKNCNQKQSSVFESAQTGADIEFKPEDLKAIDNPLANYYASNIQEHPNNYPLHDILIDDITVDGEDEMVLQINP